MYYVIGTYLGLVCGLLALSTAWAIDRFNETEIYFDWHEFLIGASYDSFSKYVFVYPLPFLVFRFNVADVEETTPPQDDGFDY